MTLQTQKLEAICRELTRNFLEAHYPGELDYFPFVWEQFAELRIEWAPNEKRTARFDANRLGLPFADEQEGGLVTPFAIPTVWFTLCELNARGLAPSPEQVEEAIRSCAKALGAPDVLGKELVKDIGSRLRELFYQLPTEQSTAVVEASGVAAIDQYDFWVEWYDRTSDPLEDPPNIYVESFDASEIETKFSIQKKDYQLYVDESKCAVMTPHHRGMINLWDELQAQHLRLLYFVLYAFRYRSVTYEQVNKGLAKGDEDCDAYQERTRRERTKSKLNEILGKLLDGLWEPKREGTGFYEAKYLIPYCWIRRAGEKSRLITAKL